MLRVQYIYHDSHGKQHGEILQTMPEEEVRDAVANPEVLDAEGLRNVIIDRDAGKVIQVSGYTPERGLYTELY